PFERKELLDRFKPAFEAQLAQAKANPYFVYETGSALDHYDLSAKSFRVLTSNLGAIGFSHYPGGNRDGGYALRFTNLKESMAVPVTDEVTARAIERQFKGLQPPQLRLYLFAQGTEPGNSYGDVGGYINAQITRIAIL